MNQTARRTPSRAHQAHEDAVFHGESGGPAHGRVLIVVQNLPVPFDRRVWLEATGLTNAGYQVTVICPKAKGFDASYERLEGVNVYRYALPVEGDGPLAFLAEFGWCFLATCALSARVGIRDGGFDIVHICNPPETYWPLAWVWQRLGATLIFDHHDLSPEMFEAKFGNGGLFTRLTSAALRWLERRTLDVADVVITTNESHRRIALERGGVEPSDIFVVRSGPAIDRLSRQKPDLTWRGGADHQLAYVGKICEQDGVDHLVRALRHLVEGVGAEEDDEPPNAHCVFVGGGPHQPAIVELAEQLGVQQHCTFTGRVSDEVLSAVLSSSDVAIDPDSKKPRSNASTINKIMEYMFFGLPIVAYGLPEYQVSAAQAAVYVPYEDNQDASEPPEVRPARSISSLLSHTPPTRQARSSPKPTSRGEAGKGRVRSRA